MKPEPRWKYQLMLSEAAFQLFGSTRSLDEIKAWLTTPCPHLDNQIPTQVARTKRGCDRVLQLIKYYPG